MLLSPAESCMLIATYLVFGASGYLAGRKFKRPVPAVVVVLMIIATLLAGYVMISMKLPSVFGLNIYMNWVLQALGLGITLNLVIRRKVFR